MNLSKLLRRKIMKRLLLAATILALFSVPAFAGGKTQRQTVIFPSAITVGTTHFLPGDCKVSWEDTGTTVQVTLTQKGNDLAITLPATVVKGEYPHGSLVMTQGEGGHILNAIQFRHFSLVLEAAEVASESTPKTDQ
jgi:hypothetical protein